jgi:glycerophosphoryl diester phosphodiesterase
MTIDTLVIAHRGASGYLPEHTLEAKALAYGQGADYLEQDIVATRDRRLVVMHDLYLELVTDVARQFPDRRRPDGHYYVIDFDLSELRQLLVTERRREDGAGLVFPNRFPPNGLGFRIATLDEDIKLIQGLNHTTGRRVGLYPEIKHPRWHAEHGVDLARLLLDELARYGYRHRDDPVFVQCFDPGELRRVRDELGTTLKLVQLVGDTQADRARLTAHGIADVARYADALGPALGQLVELSSGSGSGAPRAGEVVRATHDAGLLLHPYTFRRDKLPSYAASLEQLLELFIGTLGVDGVFCDHPDIAVRVRDAL